MSYMIVGHRGALGRATHRPTPDAALQVADRMVAEGFDDIMIQAGHLPPVTLEAFRADRAAQRKDH